MRVVSLSAVEISSIFSSKLTLLWRENVVSFKKIYLTEYRFILMAHLQIFSSTFVEAFDFLSHYAAEIIDSFVTVKPDAKFLQ